MKIPTLFQSKGNDEAKSREPWNKGKIIGQRPPLKQQEIWTIRTRLNMLPGSKRHLAMFNLAIDSKLRGCDLLGLKVKDIFNGSDVLRRAMTVQRKTSSPVQFEITRETRKSLKNWIRAKGLCTESYLFPSSIKKDHHLSTRQYLRIVKRWVSLAGLDPKTYATHTMRRTKATLIYRKSGNLRAVQILLGHKKIESTVRYLGVEVDDALQMAEDLEV